MKRVFIAIFLSGLLAISQPVCAQTATQSPDREGAGSRAQKRLAELLAPGSSIAAVTFATQPVAWKASRAVEEIPLPLKPYVGLPVRLPQMPSKSEPRPRGSGIPEAAPLVSYRERPIAPKEVKLATRPLIRLPSLDVKSPLPIPILAQPQQDRASLGDPALQASLDAALKRFTPARDRPVPFVPLNLPDPFEHIRAGQLRNPPQENPMPPVIPLKKPGK
jgi:hypothetical protein